MGDVYPLTLLERLPTELLDMAASNVGTFDLLTHVNFCRVSQRVHALYDMKYDDEFWRMQCFMSGLGYVKVRDGHASLLSWKKIAFEAVEHADACDGVCCGRAQLQQNEKAMNAWINDYPELGFGNALAKYVNCDDEELDNDTHIAMLEYITFRPSCIRDGQKREFCGPSMSSERPYLESFKPSKPGVADSHEPLFEHPIAFRTFAVFPPIKSMRLELSVHGLPEVKNHLGVTIADVCDSISGGSHTSLTALVISNAHLIPSSCGGISIAGWSFEDHLDELAFGTVAGWFRVLKCHGCSCLGWTEPVTFRPFFSRRALPENFKDFERTFDPTEEEEQALSGYSRLLYSHILRS